MRLLLLLLNTCAVRPFANKYAKFSKADEVQKNLRFSNIEDVKIKDESNADGAAAARMASPPQRSRWEYPDSAEVDQRDPTTFGFTEIGIVLGAHGTRGEIKVSSDSDFALQRLCQPGLTWLRRPRRRAPREVRLTSGRKGPGSNAFLVFLDGVGSREEAAALKGATLFVRRELRPSLEEDEMMLWELEGLVVALAERDDADGSSAAADGSNAAADGGSGGSGGSDGSESDAPVRWSVGEHVGVVTGAIPKVELTGNPNLGNDLLEVRLGSSASSSRGGGAEHDDEEEEEDDDDDDEGDTVFVPFVSQIVVDIRLEERLVLIDPPEGLLELIQPKRAERVVIRGLLPERAASLMEPAVYTYTSASAVPGGASPSKPPSDADENGHPLFIEH